MSQEDLVALLPSQPPAGKLEYSVVLSSPAGPVRVPEGEPLVMRFKGDVPALLLWQWLIGRLRVPARAARALLVGVNETSLALVREIQRRPWLGLEVVGATINRTGKAFALAIVGAEYVLGWLPKGTHQWEKFITPDELKGWLSANGAEVKDNPVTEGDFFATVYRALGIDPTTQVRDPIGRPFAIAAVSSFGFLSRWR